MSTQCLFWALKLKVGNPQRKLVLLSMADWCDSDHRCWPSLAQIAVRAECDRRSVIRHIKALEEAGLIAVSRVKSAADMNEVNVYTLQLVGSDTVSPVVTEMRGGSDTVSPVVTEMRGGSDTVSPNTPINTPIFINATAWGEWVEYQRQRRKKLTPATVTKQTMFLAQYDNPTQQIIINQSIQNGWAGLFAPKEQSNGIKNPAGNSRQPVHQGRPTKADEVRAARERARLRDTGGFPDLGSVVTTQ